MKTGGRNTGAHDLFANVSLVRPSCREYNECNSAVSFYGVLSVFSRSRLKSGLLICTIVFASTILFQLAWTHSIRVANALVILETGSGASAVAISIVLIATL